MTTAWITIGVLFIGTALAKAAGPLTTGGKPPSGRALHVTRLVAPAILAALVAYETFTAEDGFAVDARVVGLAAAVLAILARAPMIVTILLAAGATALTRALI